MIAVDLVAVDGQGGPAVQISFGFLSFHFEIDVVKGRGRGNARRRLSLSIFRLGSTLVVSTRYVVFDVGLLVDVV